MAQEGPREKSRSSAELSARLFPLAGTCDVMRHKLIYRGRAARILIGNVEHCGRA